MDERTRRLLLFIIPSAAGVLLFMVPIKVNGVWTIAVKLLADTISAVIGDFLPLLCAAILTVSAVMAIAAQFKPGFIVNNEVLADCFCCSPVWVAVRVLGCIFAWLTYLGIGAHGGALDFSISAEGWSSALGVIAHPDQGGVALDLISGLVIIFAIASFLLPLLLDFGLLEFVGALLTKYMRPVFRVPGRAAVDCITSWIGDGTLGVMLTCNQYEAGYYSAREAAVISTTFSAVSITFSLVVLNQVGMMEYFGIYYLLICFVGILCAIICPRIPPLSYKKDTYLVPGRAMAEDLPEGFTTSRQYGMYLAMERVAEHKGIREFFYSGSKNCVSMWFSVLPTVMCIGTVALILANHTNIFQILGTPFVPLFELLRVEDAAAASSTMIVGFADMFTPSVLIAASGAAKMTKFIVAVVSVTQVLFLDEVGGLILGSKLPINIVELFIIFLERTLISIVVVSLAAHIIF